MRPAGAMMTLVTIGLLLGVATAVTAATGPADPDTRPDDTDASPDNSTNESITSTTVGSDSVSGFTLGAGVLAVLLAGGYRYLGG